VHAGDGTSWTVVAEGDASWRGTPLHRFVRVHPVEGLDALDAALRPVARHLSSVAVAAADDETHRAIGARAAAAGASRVCAPGRMQAPPLDWPHDGRLLLAPLARVAAHEGEVD